MTNKLTSASSVTSEKIEVIDVDVSFETYSNGEYKLLEVTKVLPKYPDATYMVGVDVDAENRRVTLFQWDTGSSSPVQSYIRVGKVQELFNTFTWVGKCEIVDESMPKKSILGSNNGSVIMDRGVALKRQVETHIQGLAANLEHMNTGAAK